MKVLCTKCLLLYPWMYKLLISSFIRSMHIYGNQKYIKSKLCPFYQTFLSSFYFDFLIFEFYQTYKYFRLLWPCIMNVGRRKRNQKDAANLVFIIKLIYQHVSGNIKPIFSRTRLRITANGVLHCNSVTVQNTICSYTQSCSPEDWHNDARNKLI